MDKKKYLSLDRLTEYDALLKNKIAIDDTAILTQAKTDASNQDAVILFEAQTYTDAKTTDMATTTVVDSKISSHNTSTTTHNDIRNLITGLTNRLNALADSDDTTLDQMSEIVAYIKSNKSLIDSITTSKVNVVDIVNNLTTNVSNKPLSAAQGASLKGLIDALQTEVNSKAGESHNHAISDVINLQTELDSLENSISTHTHKYAGSSSVGGAATSAEKLATARKIGINGGATGTATSFDGSGDINIPITSIKDNYITWNADNSVDSSLKPFMTAMMADGSANRLAYMNASHIKVEYSRDRGVTWLDYGASDSDKTGLVTNNKKFFIGKYGSDSAKVTADWMLRITITAENNLYFALEKLAFQTDTSGAEGAYCNIEYSKIGSDTTFHEIKSNIACTGWPAWTVWNYKSSFGGYDGQTNNWRCIRLTFGITGVSTTYSNAFAISHLRAFGGTSYVSPSNMAINGHLYSYDSNQNATFPAKVTATTFTGSLSGNASSATKATQDGDGNIITSTYAKQIDVDQAIADVNTNKADATHTHDDRYYTEAEVDTAINNAKNIWYGTCSTGGTTMAKVVTTSTGDFSLTTGNIVYILFTNYAYFDSTLNVDGTGAKTIKVAGSSNVASYQWAPNELVGFVYDGTYFRMLDGAIASTTYYGMTKLSSSTSSTSTTYAATPSAVKSAYDLANTAKTNAEAAQTRADDAYTLAEGKADSLSDLGITATATELNHLDGVTSNVQTQLDNKADASHTHTITAGANDDDVVVLSGTNGSNKVTYTASHATSGVTSGTYKSVTVNEYGHVTAGTNPTTLSGYGITDAYTETEIDTKLNGKADSNHTHTTSLATDTGDSTITLAHGEKYKLTAGGSSVIFTMPTDNNYVTIGAKSGTTVGFRATAEGDNTTASGSYSHAEGDNTTASGESSHAEGYNTTASGESSHAEGYNTIASHFGSHAEGSNTTASGNYSHAEGYYTIARSGSGSHAEGSNTTASGNYSHAEGYYTIASGSFSHAGGCYTIANGYQYVVGKYNADTTAPTSIDDTTTSAGLFIVGIGTSNSNRKNGFRVNPAGKCYSQSTFGTSGADYAEYFEWLDGNPNNEDRRGHFVALEGGKIRYANPNDDYILGVVSADPSVAGDIHSENWHNMHLKDVFGSPIIEVVEVEETTNEDGEVIPAHTERRLVLNPDYNPDVKYISREERPEWAAIGLVGKLVVVDDGTCQVNGYCYPNADGIATVSQEKTNYRVMERLDDTHIRIFIK